MVDAAMTEDDMQRLYQWIDEIPLSRPKRNIGRDFSDGVLAAELAAHFFPKLVELHNYSAANSVSQKTYNWNTLNQKVFKKMGFQIGKHDIEGVCACAPGVVERVLRTLQHQILIIKETGSFPQPKPKAAAVAKNRSPPVVKSAGAAPGRPQQEKPKAPRRSTEAPEQRGVGNRREQKEEDPYAPPARGQAGGFERRNKLPEMDANNPPERHQRRDPRDHESEIRKAPQRDPAPNHYELEPAPYVPPVQQMPAFNAHVQRDVDTEILVEKEQTIQELRETVDILETKIRKLEQLVKLKDTKIQSLQQKLSS